MSSGVSTTLTAIGCIEMPVKALLLMQSRRFPCGFLSNQGFCCLKMKLFFKRFKFGFKSRREVSNHCDLDWYWTVHCLLTVAERFPATQAISQLTRHTHFSTQYTLRQLVSSPNPNLKLYPNPYHNHILVCCVNTVQCASAVRPTCSPKSNLLQ